MHEILTVPDVNFQLTPIFVTGDKRLSKLHRICNNKFLIENNNSLFNIPELSEMAYYEDEKFKWKEKEILMFKERSIKDLPKRLSRSGIKRSADHLIPMVEDYEKKVWEILSKV